MNRFIQSSTFSSCTLAPHPTIVRLYFGNDQWSWQENGATTASKNITRIIHDEKKERKKKRFTGRELATEKKARVCLVIKAGRLNREISLKIDASTSNVTFPYSDFSLSFFFFFSSIVSYFSRSRNTVVYP